MEIPKDIEKHLTRDEVVEKEFRLNNLTLYASSNRLLLIKGGLIKDIGYNKISGIEIKIKPNWILITIGILAGLIGYYLQDNAYLNYSLVSVSVILFLSGFIFRRQQIDLKAANISESWTFSGHKDTLNSILNIVREHRAKSKGLSPIL